MDNNTLTRITQFANARIDELFDSGSVRTIPQITVGMARIILAVAAELECAPPPVSTAPPTPSPNGRLSLDQFRAEAIDTLRRLAGERGTWVSMADFDAARPTSLPTASGVCKRLEMSWTEIVGAALGSRTQTPPRIERMIKTKQEAVAPNGAGFRGETHHESTARA